MQKINLFRLNLIFFPENTIICHHFVPNTLEIQSRIRLTYSQSQYSKRLLNVVTHKHYKIWPLWFIRLSYQFNNQHSFLTSVTITWNFGCPTFAITLSLTSGSYSCKIVLAIKECKIFGVINIRKHIVCMRVGGEGVWPKAYIYCFSDTTLFVKIGTRGMGSQKLGLCYVT